jgi:C-terminal processing protease CtpA/Prc
MDLIWNGNNLYVSVIEKSKAEQIPLGSRIIAIDGIPAEQYLENNIYKYISDNTLQHKRLQAIEPLMTGKSGDSISFVLLTPQQQERTVFIAYDVMQRKVMKTDLAGLKASRFFRRSGNDTFLVDHENFNFYYFKPHGFTMRSITNYIKDAMPKLEKADYVVLDLRNNEGGSELQADTLLACFIDCKELRTYKSLTRSNNAFYRAMGYGYPQYKDYYNGMHMDTLPESIIVKKELPLIRKPLFILISEETYSAAEDLLVTLKLHYPDRAILVGKPTGGSSGAPLVNRLSNEVYYRICTRKALLPEGMFENGVQPDYDYEPSIQELISGEDFIFKYVQQLYRQHYENK